MKKISKKQKNRLILAAKRELKKKIRQKKFASEKAKRVVLPEVLSLISTKNHTLICKAIANIHRHILSRETKKIILDFSNVKRISPEGMLLLYAELDTANKLRKNTIFTIKPPINNRCAQVLVKIKLYETLGKKPPEKILSDESVIHWHYLCNTNAQPIGWEKIDREIRDCGENPKQFYTPVTEAITNSIHHGYFCERGGYFTCKKAFGSKSKWWMFLQVRNNEFHVSLIDLGIGFSGSMRHMHLKDENSWLSQLFTRLSRWRNQRPENIKDKEILERLMRQDTRLTSTEKKYRGKGINQICELALSNERAHLRIWSNNGSCHLPSQNISKSSAKRIVTPVQYNESINGTLLYWTVPF